MSTPDAPAGAGQETTPVAEPAPPSRWLFWLCVAALAVGLVVRIAVVPGAHWTDDETGMYVQGLGIASGKGFPVFGPPITATVARLPGPGVHYFDAFALLIGRGHVYAIGIALALLQIAGVAVFVRAIWEALSPLTATVLAWLLCLGPWPVLFADRPMNTHHALAATLLFGGFLVLGLLRRQALFQGLAAVLLVILPQLHLSGLLLGVVLVSLALVSYLSHRRTASPAEPWPLPAQLHWKALAIGAALGLASYVPGLVFELTTGFANARAFLGRATGDGRDAWEWGRSLLGPLLFATDEIGWFALRGYWIPSLDPVLYARTGWLREHLARFYGPMVPVVVGSVLVSLAAHVQAVRRLRAPGRPAGFPVDPWTLSYLVLLVSAAALLLAGRKIYFPHYNVLALPLTALLVARLVAGVAERGRLWRTLAAVWVLAASLSGGLVIERYYRLVDSTSSLTTQRKMAANICRRQEGRPFMLSFAQDVYPSFAALELLAKQIRCNWDVNGGGATRYRVEGAWSAEPKAPPDSEMRVFRYGAARLVLIAPPGDPALAP